MQNLYEDLVAVLGTDDRLVADGHVMKNKVVELALRLDADVLRLVRSHDRLRQHFFVEVDGVAIFDKVKFQQFVSNKAFLPDSYTAFKNKIGLMDGDQYLVERPDVVLAWPYKDCVLEGGQYREDAQRQEFFWNETLAPDQIDRLLTPKVLVGAKRYTKDGVADATSLSEEDNLIIKGNNLLALHTLMPVYSGRVKLIYIDPPYNTGSDSFKYNDSFRHSTWMTFMKNRLTAAKNLLKDDGVICINIDDKEGYYLKVLCDEVFGRENFIANIVVKTSDPSGHKTVNPGPYSQSEYILMYSKNKKAYRYAIQYVPSNYDEMYSDYVLNVEDECSSWRFSKVAHEAAVTGGFSSPKEAAAQLGFAGFYELQAKFGLDNKKKVFQRTAIADDAGREVVSARDRSLLTDEVLMVAREGKNPIYIQKGRQLYFYDSKVKIIDGIETPAKPLTNIWTDIPYNGISGEGGVRLKNGKKPEKLLRRIIEISSSPGDLIVDFHAGSGTTLAVALKMGRRFIGVEQISYGENDAVVRLKNVVEGDKTGVSKVLGWKGGGSFVYAELAQANEAFVQRILSSASEDDLAQVWRDMQQRAFLSYRVDVRSIDRTAKDWQALSLDNKKRLLMETLDKNMLYVPLSEMEDATWGVSDADKALNRDFFGV